MNRYVILISLIVVILPALVLAENSCFTSEDLKEALDNGRCWVIVDEQIYDVTNNSWWDVFGTYECGESVSLKNLNITPHSPENESGLMRELNLSTNVGRLCETRSVEKPKNCGDKECDLQENFASCPQDCFSGTRDGYCVCSSDFICDPDCQRTGDPDCICNMDGKCEVGIENYGNCIPDCRSGSGDNYCDKLFDHRCDPDCGPGEDPDCPVTTVSTTIIETCDNGVCDSPGENYGNCPVDCSSGSPDGYCDGMDDGVCDPDCKPGDDPDCAEATIETTTTEIKPAFPGGDYLIPILVIIVILAVISVFFVIYKRRTERCGEDKKTIGWLRDELRKGENPETLRKLLDEEGYDPKLVDKAMEE